MSFEVFFISVCNFMLSVLWCVLKLSSPSNFCIHRADEQRVSQINKLAIYCLIQAYCRCTVSLSVWCWLISSKKLWYRNVVCPPDNKAKLHVKFSSSSFFKLLLAHTFLLELPNISLKNPTLVSKITCKTQLRLVFKVCLFFSEYVV